MFSSSRNRNPSYSPTQQRKQQEEPPPWLATSLNPENFIPGIVIGFLLGLFFDFSSSRRGPTAPAPFKGNRRSFPGKSQSIASDSNHRGGGGGGTGVGADSEEELKMVLVVRQDLRMGVGKIASQCAHAATGMYSDLLQSHRFLLRQ